MTCSWYDVDLNVHTDWETLRKLVKHTSVSIWELSREATPWMWVAASTRLGTWMEQSAENSCLWALYLFSSKCVFAAATTHDIRLQILQLLNLDLHQCLSRELPGLQPWDGAAPCVAFFCSEPSSLTDCVTCRQPGRTIGFWTWKLFDYISLPLGLFFRRLLTNTVGRTWASQEVTFTLLRLCRQCCGG